MGGSYILVKDILRMWDADKKELEALRKKLQYLTEGKIDNEEENIVYGTHANNAHSPHWYKRTRTGKDV